MQRQSDEEDLLQGNMIQRQEDEEDLMQGKMIQREAMDDADPLQGKALQRRETGGQGGLPDPLRSGIESLSGLSMEEVQVHRNSAAHAQVGAHAYAQGRDNHLGPGQERHLPHEAWHVVQQAQGRVRPTLQAKGEAINDDPGLEREADQMGARAAQFKPSNTQEEPLTVPVAVRQDMPIQRIASPAVVQRIGEPLDQQVLDDVDDQAWATALAATAHLRPDGQRAEQKDRGYSEGMDANTRITARDRQGVEVTDFSENEAFSNTNARERLGQMTALFVHELSYHGNSSVAATVGTEAETSQDEEHHLMFARSDRERMLTATRSALERLPDTTSRVEYVLYWQEDLLDHIDTARETAIEAAEDPELFEEGDYTGISGRTAKEARSWVKWQAKQSTTAIFRGAYG